MIDEQQIRAIEGSMTNDPGDRHVLAAAVIMNAERILTRNVTDFPESACAPFGIVAATSDRLFTGCLRSDPEGMIQALFDQTRDIPGRERTIDKVLTDLRNAQCRSFADEAEREMRTRGLLL